MRKDLQEIVMKALGLDDSQISEAEIAEIEQRCIRKMELNGTENKEEYLPLLFMDEVRYYCFAKELNALSLVMMSEEVASNVCGM